MPGVVPGMAKVYANMSMSLDGFVAEPSDGVGPLFDWYNNGSVPVTMPGDHPARHARMSETSAKVLTGRLESLGALVAGRRLFDYAQGWGGAHPAGVPVFVVSHRAPDIATPYAFVSDGVASAVDQAVRAAGGKDVAIASPDITQQALAAGLLDEISVDLVPVLLGKGIRLFGDLADGHVTLSDPTVVEGTRVTHLTYRVYR